MALKPGEHRITMLGTLATLAADLDAGRRRARDLADACLDAAARPEGEGARVYIALDPERTRAEADASDMLRRHGIVPSRLAGLPISLKDLFDVMGQVTGAGSRALGHDAKPAPADAPPVRRLRAAGAVFTGRTNMTEFAYSGVGLNPHFGTPANPFDRATGRIPGGSTSGGVVSVTDGMAAAAIGTDTGGSCRIPAALCGIVGYKPTARRIPLDGCVPLSPSFDSIGSLAPSVACVALIDQIMAGAQPRPLEPAALDGLRIAVPTNFVLDEMDETVGRAFEAALSRLGANGARVIEGKFPVLEALPELVKHGGITAAESYAWHRDLLERHGDDYDPRVRTRIAMGESFSASDYQALLARRAELIAVADAAFAPFDVIAMPQVPIVAPPFSAFEEDEEFTRLNRLLLRNPSVANFSDRCGITLPCGTPDSLPVGLGLVGPRDGDSRLLAIAAAIEAALADR